MIQRKRPKAVVLLSGGMDSSTCLAIAVSMGFDCYTLSLDYGQRHRAELGMAKLQAKAFGAKKHLMLKVDLKSIGGSALTGRQAIPKTQKGGVPPTYVPARNAIFLSLGLAWAEVLGARDLFVGANQVDFSGYPDCRGDFLRSFEKLANLATQLGRSSGEIRVRAPLLNLDKASIIRRGFELGVNFKNTLTCYDPPKTRVACGRCPSCRIRMRGFKNAGMKDPIPRVR
jgi:7-cyano-7-deazaguanine synthase